MKTLFIIFTLLFPALVNGVELRILCWEGYAPKKFTRIFEDMISKKYGVNLKLTVKHVSSPQEFYNWIRIKEIDLISPAHNIPKSYKWKLIEQKLVLPINLNNVPNYQHLISELKNAEYLTHKGRVYGVPIVYGPYGLAYNTQYFDKAPDSWDILWDPKYKNRFSISADYYEANIYSAGLAAGLNKEEIFDFDRLWNNPTIKNKLELLAENAKSFWVGTDKVSDLDGLALAAAWGFSFSGLEEKGQIWKFAQPKEGTTGWVDNWLISHTLKNKPLMKKIAEEWINFSVGEQMQLYYVRELRQFPVNLAIKSKLTNQEIKTYKLDNPDYFKNNIILWKTLSLREQNGLKYMWRTAKNN